MAFVAAVTCESSGSNALATQRGGGGGARGEGKQLVFCYGQKQPQKHTKQQQQSTVHTKRPQKKKKSPTPPKTKTEFQHGTFLTFSGGVFLFFLAPKFRHLATNKQETRRVSGITTCVNEWLLPPPTLTRHILRQRKFVSPYFETENFVSSYFETKKILYRHIWTKVLVSDFLKKNIWW